MTRARTSIGGAGGGVGWFRSAAWSVGAAVLSLAASGCADVMVHGKAIEGDASLVGVVDERDPRLAEPGLADVMVAARSDPGHLSAETLGQTVTDSGGWFDLTLEGLRAQGELGFSARKRGFQHASAALPAPGVRGVLLIVLRRGPDRGDDDASELLERLR